MDEEMNNIVELIDENNELISFEYLMSLDYDGKEYIVLIPLNPEIESAEDEIIILRVEQDEEGNDFYEAIEDDKELDDVFDVVNQVYEQTLN
ncbi:MAG TPA: DUF1292 domain-containing protein [Clostridiales bacterium]|nr:DUF1292 domain-containing protein [Clostridia bacterium]HCS75118.1 DUF1292 domain-containing protein [Clostridiales bacterium]